jgi:predicted amidohydrolase YtcJ
VAVNHHLTPEFLADLEKARTQYHDDWVSANLVKFFSDGGSGLIPPLTYTAPEFRKLVSELDKRGYQLMTHSLRGDTAHMVLDAYEEVEKSNAARDRRLRMEHADIVWDEDIPRFKKLNVVVSMQPTFCCGDSGANFDPKDKTPTDRWNSLEKTGATLAFGSDWPCTWPPDPFVSMQEMATRQVWRAPSISGLTGAVLDGANQGGAVGTLLSYVPAERVSVETAVRGYTWGSAYARFSEDKQGTLEAGKEADLAVLSQDIFTAPADQISKTKVQLTMVGGRVVFQETN